MTQYEATLHEYLQSILSAAGQVQTLLEGRDDLNEDPEHIAEFRVADTMMWNLVESLQEDEEELQ